MCFWAVQFGFAGSVTSAPTIDFGSAGYVSGSSSGFKIITMSAAGAGTTSGSGALTGYTSGSAGSATIGDFSWAESLNGTITFQTNRTTASTTISTPGCGSISVSNFTTTNGATSTTASASSSSSVSFPVGATITLQSFSGTSGCTISGTVTGPVQFRIRGWIVTQTDWTDVPVTVSVYIAPHMSFSHDANAVLNFGKICSSASQQTITVSSDGNVTTTNAYCPVTGTSADSFTATGMVGQVFHSNFPTSATISNGTNSLTVTNFTSACSDGCTLTDSTYTFGVGATLTVPAYTPSGDYTGTYPVTITY